MWLVSASDLRFTPDEASQHLREALGVSLSQTDASVLEARTEGCFVGLQMAVLSRKGRTDLV